MDVHEFKNLVWDYTREISDSANKIFNPVCEQYGLTMLQFRVLMELYRYGSHTIGSLADGLYVAGTNMSTMCKKLESMGLLRRFRDQADERVVKISLTEKGNRIISEMDRRLNERFTRSFDNETTVLFDDIIRGMKKLSYLLKKMTEEE